MLDQRLDPIHRIIIKRQSTQDLSCQLRSTVRMSMEMSNSLLIFRGAVRLGYIMQKHCETKHLMCLFVTRRNDLTNHLFHVIPSAVINLIIYDP